MAEPTADPLRYTPILPPLIESLAQWCSDTNRPLRRRSAGLREITAKLQTYQERKAGYEELLRRGRSTELSANLQLEHRQQLQFAYRAAAKALQDVAEAHTALGNQKRKVGRACDRLSESIETARKTVTTGQLGHQEAVARATLLQTDKWARAWDGDPSARPVSVVSELSRDPLQNEPNALSPAPSSKYVPARTRTGNEPPRNTQFSPTAFAMALPPGHHSEYSLSRFSSVSENSRDSAASSVMSGPIPTDAATRRAQRRDTFVNPLEPERSPDPPQRRADSPTRQQYPLGRTAAPSPQKVPKLGI